MQRFWKVFAGVWLVAGAFAAGALLIALMPAMIIAGASFLLSVAAIFSSSGSPTAAQSMASITIVTAIMAFAVFSAIFLALRLLVKRLWPNGTAALPPAE